MVVVLTRGCTILIEVSILPFYQLKIIKGNKSFPVSAHVAGDTMTNHSYSPVMLWINLRLFLQWLLPDH